MAQKKISDLTLRSSVEADVNFAGDDGIQTYRVTAEQIYDFMRTRFVSEAYYLSNLTIAASVSSNALTIAVKTKAGTDPSASDPVYVSMRSSSLVGGGYNVRTITSALSLTISSGSTLGQKGGGIQPLWIYLIDNAGTLELAVSTVLQRTDYVVTTVAEGGAGAADSNAVIYSASARTSVPARPIARMTSTQATPGTWASAPSSLTLVNPSQPSQPHIIDPLFAQYSSAAGQSIGTGVSVIVDYGTAYIDSHNTVTTGAAWKFTAPRASVYKVTAAASFANAAFTAGNTTAVTIFLNGVSWRIISADIHKSAGTYGIYHVGQGDMVYMGKGDYIDVRAFHNEAGVSRSLSANGNQVYISVQDAGNYE